MLSRREVLASGLVGGLSGDVVDGRRELQPTAEVEALNDIEEAVEGVTASLDRAFNTLSTEQGPVTALRRNFDQFIRATGKFPDYCDIGLKVFYEMYDWHIRHRQQIVVVRQPDNRYTIQFMFTTLLLRHEYDPNYISYPYDKG